MEKTIEDALFVSAKMGFDDIWIDRYCIDQSELKKHLQIQHMGIIYRNAGLTIFAAAGKDPAFGLPGVSTAPLTQLLSFDTGPFRIKCETNLEEALKTSTWNTRAWAYQEYRFSRRRLIFTEEQVTFGCCLSGADDDASEEANESNARVPFHRMQSYQNFSPGMGGGCGVGKASLITKLNDLTHVRTSHDEPCTSEDQREASSAYALAYEHQELYKAYVLSNYSYGAGKFPWDIGHWICKYPTRDLTYPSDALNAFSGIVRAFEDLVHPVYHPWGVPILPSIRKQQTQTTIEETPIPRSCSDGFILGLCWKHASPATRRPSFPSWSWAGWSCAVSFKEKFAPCEPYESQGRWAQSTEIDVAIELESGAELAWKEFEDRGMKQKTAPFSHVLLLDAWTIPAKLKYYVNGRRDKWITGIESRFLCHICEQGRLPIVLPSISPR